MKSRSILLETPKSLQLPFSNYTKHRRSKTPAVYQRIHRVAISKPFEAREKSSGSRTRHENFPSGGRTEEEAMNGALDFPILSNAGLKRRRERKRRGEVSTPRYFLSWIQCDPEGAVTWTRALLFSPEYGGNFSTREGKHRTPPLLQVDHTGTSLSLSFELQICGHPVCLTGGSASIGSGNCLSTVTTSSRGARKGKGEGELEVPVPPSNEI